MDTSADKEIKLLSKITANHLFLAQFEPLRATLLSLRKLNPSLSQAILQTIITQGGKINGVLWSDSCSSPSLLTWLSSLLLLEFDEASSSISNLDPDLFKSRVEFLLLIQLVISRVSENLKKSNDNLDDTNDYRMGLEDSVNVLNRISELGLRRLRRGNSEIVVIREEEFEFLTKLYLDQSEIFDAICCNIEKQVHWFDLKDESGLAINVHVDEKTREDSDEELRILQGLQKSVQVAHLEALKELVKENDFAGAISHIRFLHLDYGVLETEYKLLYLLDATGFYSPGLHALGIHVCRATGQELMDSSSRISKIRSRERDRLRGPPWLKAVQRVLLSCMYTSLDYAQTGLIAAVFFFKMMEWWYQSAEERMSAPTVYPPPPPPPPPKVAEEGIPLPSDRSFCPLCSQKRVNPSVLSVSGFVFCYPCIFRYVSQYKRCPVTLMPTNIEQIRRLFHDM